MTTQSSQASVDEPGPEQTNRPKDDFFTKLRRVDMRRTSDSWVGGVCAGLGHRVGLDPLVIRAGAVLLGIFFGLGLLAYLLAWFLIPDRNEQTHAEMGLRGGRGSSIFLFVVTVLVGLGGLTTGVFGWSNFSFADIAVTLVIGWALWYVWTRRPETGAVSQRAYSPPPPPSTDVMADPVRGDAGRPSPDHVGMSARPFPLLHPERRGARAPVAPSPWQFLASLSSLPEPSSLRCPLNPWSGWRLVDLLD
ncbi:PspC domain-containing protein [Ornithinimicrobium sp. INDO-MA30-4]|uniref:PspC domain-containing protein n=1 Tax=Ornithinimicrobium sp. INDO-MA30-4 TaxID=2908651 RepID=UPI001F1E7C73|nr:PspC domain-containing protein [Ornithinimicrobium sp. INDO-MA30-4]UJH69725.1 PspC domain-containing protein [Ornithinimicrobium sp. INDO-MA30-4]